MADTNNKHIRRGTTHHGNGRVKDPSYKNQATIFYSG